MAAAALLYALPETSGSLWGDYLKTLSVLVGLCILSMAGARFVIPRLRATLPGSGLIRVLATHSLEAGKALYIVKAGETAVLVATSGGAVHLLATLEDAAGLEAAQAAESNREAGMPGAGIITRLLGGRSARR